MAGADYCSCAVCGGKTFYDAALHYPDLEEVEKGWPVGLPVGSYDLASLCHNCAQTHEIIVQRKDPTQ